MRAEPHRRRRLSSGNAVVDKVPILMDIRSNATAARKGKVGLRET